MVGEALLTQYDDACRIARRDNDARGGVSLLAVPHTFVLQPCISNAQLPC